MLRISALWLLRDEALTCIRGWHLLVHGFLLSCGACSGVCLIGVLVLLWVNNGREWENNNVNIHEKSKTKTLTQFPIFFVCI